MINKARGKKINKDKKLGKDYQLLKEFPLFDNFSKKDLKLIAPQFDIQQFGPSEIIFRENDTSNGLFLVYTGSVQVLKGVEDGQEVVLAEIGAGNIFGEMALFDERKRSGTIKTIEDCKLLHLSNKNFLNLIRNFPDIGLDILGTLVGRMRNLHTKYIHEVEENRKTLANSYDALRKLEWERRQFVNLASHELRTPITSIMMAINFLRDAIIEENKQNNLDALFKLVIKEIRQLSTIVDNIFQLSVKEKIHDITLAKFDFIEICRNTLAEIKLLARERKLKFSISSPHKTLLIRANPDKIYQIIFNLLHNAIKFTRDGGTIDIQLDKDEKMLHFSVIDNGIGIPKEHFQHIFQPFCTLEDWKHHKSAPDSKSIPSLAFGTIGAGIGLSLVQNCIRMHGGRIELESEERKGSCFKILLPLNL
ncbi:sensor histidine kinase [Candidatus Riflebacteria bacterium]